MLAMGLKSCRVQVFHPKVGIVRLDEDPGEGDAMESAVVGVNGGNTAEPVARFVPDFVGDTLKRMRDPAGVIVVCTAA